MSNLSMLEQPAKAAILSVFILLLWRIASSVKSAFRPGLKTLPGPAFARFTSLYRASKIAQGNAPKFYMDLHERYGDIVRTGPNTVDFADPKALPIIYGINSNFLKSSFYDTLTPIYKGAPMQSMFTARDPSLHRSLRRPVAQKFSMSSIKSFEPATDECTSIFINAMRDLEGQVIDLGAWLQWYAFDVIGEITFQRRFGFMEERRDIHRMIEGIEGVLVYASVVGQVPAVHSWLMGNPWVIKLLETRLFDNFPNPLKTIIEFIQECIDDYDRKPAEQHSERPDFLAWLRAEEKKGQPMPNRDLINHLSNNLFAGSDTTGIALRAVIYFLIKNPETYAKLQSEIDIADKTGKLSEFVSYAECLEMPYLQAVLKEAMRHHPGVSFPLERVVPAEGATICGVNLEGGVVVGINPAVIHHRTDIFGADAAVFRPERWLEQDEGRIKEMDRHLLTFGAGTRTCIGKNISILEMGKLIPQLLRHFEITWASEEPEWRVKTFWFARQQGLNCRFKARTQKSS